MNANNEFTEYRQLCSKQFLHSSSALFNLSLDGRASNDFGLKFKSFNVNGERPGTVRCLKSALNFKKSLNKSDDARRCFMGRTATGDKRCVFAEEHIAST